MLFFKVFALHVSRQKLWGKSSPCFLEVSVVAPGVAWGAMTCGMQGSVGAMTFGLNVPKKWPQVRQFLWLIKQFILKICFYLHVTVILQMYIIYLLFNLNCLHWTQTLYPKRT